MKACLYGIMAEVAMIAKTLGGYLHALASCYTHTHTHTYTHTHTLPLWLSLVYGQSKRLMLKFLCFFFKSETECCLFGADQCVFLPGRNSTSAQHLRATLHVFS